MLHNYIISLHYNNTINAYLVTASSVGMYAWQAGDYPS